MIDVLKRREAWTLNLRNLLLHAQLSRERHLLSEVLLFLLDIGGRRASFVHRGKKQ